MKLHELQALSKDLDALHEKHTAHPAVILIQPVKGRSILALMVGSPSKEWLCHVMSNELAQYGYDALFMAPSIPKHVINPMAKVNGKVN